MREDRENEWVWVLWRSLLTKAPPVRQTRTMVGHLWVSVWDTSGESGVSGESPVSPCSSWGTETERPFYW